MTREIILFTAHSWFALIESRARRATVTSATLVGALISSVYVARKRLTGAIVCRRETGIHARTTGDAGHVVETLLLTLHTGLVARHAEVAVVERVTRGSEVRERLVGGAVTVVVLAVAVID
jgi:hypothetical protein